MQVLQKIPNRSILQRAAEDLHQWFFGSIDWGVVAMHGMVALCMALYIYANWQMAFGREAEPAALKLEECVVAPGVFIKRGEIH